MTRAEKKIKREEKIADYKRLMQDAMYENFQHNQDIKKSLIAGDNMARVLGLANPNDRALIITAQSLLNSEIELLFRS